MSRSWMAGIAGAALFWNLGCGTRETPKPQAENPTEKAPREVKTASLSEPDAVPAQKATAHSAAAEAAFERLLNASQDSDPDEWTRSEAALTELGPEAVPVLARQLANDNPFARELAAQFLAQLGPSAASAEPQLVAALADDSSLVKMNAAAALLSMNSAAKEIASALQSLLSDADDNVRLPAAISLAGMKETEAEAIAALTELLTSSDAIVRRGAVEALGRLGEKASSSVTAVRRLADDDSTDVRTAATAALRRIESGESPSEETIPAGGVEE